MGNCNRWIPVSECYPPNGTKVEALFDGKVCNATFHETEDYRSWNVDPKEYDGVLLPTMWRFPEDVIGVVLKIDIDEVGL